MLELHSALINRDTKLIRINTVSIAVIGLLVAKIFFTDLVTIVTPPNMNEEITVVGNKASESYKTQWALFLVPLGNINPTNISFVTAHMSSMPFHLNYRLKQCESL